MKRGVLGFLLVALVTPAWAQEAVTKRPSELIVGKLIYVAPMPNGLDTWIQDFIRRWGMYKVTSNPEGVDLVIRAYRPDKAQEFEMRNGIPQPKGAGEDRRWPLPGKKKGKKELPAATVMVIDWVTNQPIWQADILDRKPKKNRAEPPAGPQTEIYARGLTSDQLAQRLVSRLRDYVSELRKNESNKH
jgi:hypothetical protein